MQLRPSLALLTDVAPNVLRGLAKEAGNGMWRKAFGRPIGPPPDREASRYKYAIRAPWPQPNPHAPGELAPSVLHLPQAELNEFTKVTMGRLVRQLRRRTLPAMAFAHRQRDVPAISDSEHVRFLTETIFSRAMTTDLGASDHLALGALAQGPGAVYKLDLTAAGLLEAIPGTFTAACIAYFARHRPEERCVPLGMVFPRAGEEPLLIRPEDGAAWEVAKHYAIMSSANLGLFGTHPLVHFPVDAINALTKSVLPTDHVLSRLLMPHMYIQLCLNFSVMFVDKSPLHNRQSEFFTGFTHDGKESPLKIARTVYSGIPGNSSYPAYTFPREIQPTHSDYSQFLEGYYRIIKSFVAEVLADVAVDDPHVQRWIVECAKFVRGFPGLDEMQERDRFVSTVAYIICNASVIHSADHYSFASIPMMKQSLRMRVPPPRSRTIPPLDRSTLTTVEDRFRIFLTNEMHIRPSTETRLGEVDYGFTQPHLQQANVQFREQLKAYDRNPGVTRHAPLDDIACSIQY